MKRVMPFVLIAFISFLSITTFAQQLNEDLIRKLDDAEREAIFKGDTLQLSRLMSSKIVVQNPENTIVGFQKIMDRIKSGKINYSTFERRIDNIAIVNNIAIIMGLETVVPQGNTKNAGKTVQRRFTNIWTQEADGWKLTARQATIISIGQ
jgi:ketosteroid isomerase-like protein